MSIHDQAAQRGWLEFIKQPQPALKTVVREFYANAKEHRDKKVFVRGKWVSFDRTAINRHYRLTNIDDDEYSQYRLRPNTNDIIELLTQNRVRWKTTENDVIYFPSSGMNYEIKAWHYFIYAKLLPSGNTYEVKKERAILNYAIQKGLSIDVGRIIETSILDWLRGGTTGGLGHASLIYALCTAKNIPTTASEEVLHPQAAITRRKIEQYKSSLEPIELPEATLAHDTEATPSSSAPSTSTPDIHTLNNDMAQMQLFMRAQQQWQRSVDHSLGQIMLR